MSDRPRPTAAPSRARAWTTDFLVIGGGVIGLRLALEARRRHPGARITLIEKESTPGLHASGRNSGVLHAGFYYTADSLKARFTRLGNEALQQYCVERGLPIRRCGKLIVARNDAEEEGLDELLRRAHTNGVELHEVTDRQAREIEPRVRTTGRALFSPSTASVDPRAVLAALAADAAAQRIEIVTDTAYLGRSKGGVHTSRGEIEAGFVVNAAGLHADRVAHGFGFARDHRILPFRGLYLIADGADGALRTNIYPVPELRHPFLGVHYTLTVDGHVKIGPNAIPALWREQYGGLGGFRFGDLLEIGRRQLGLLVSDSFGFRRLAARELAKASRRRLVRMAGELVREPISARWRWSKPGIRAQLIDVRRGTLEMDFRFEGDSRSFHVLNVVSPGFTCAFPFASHLFDRIDELTAGAPATIPVASVPAAMDTTPEELPA